MSLGLTGLAVALTMAVYFVFARPAGSPPVAADPAPAGGAFTVGAPAPPRDLGDVARGERVTVPCLVRNDTPAAVTVGPFQTSCDCFSIDLIRSVIPAGEHVSGTLVLDFANEPHFRGGLMLSAEAPVTGSPRPLSVRLTVSVR